MVPMEQNELAFWQSRSVINGKLSAPFELTDIPKLAKDVRHASNAAAPIAHATLYGAWIPTIADTNVNLCGGDIYIVLLNNDVIWSAPHAVVPARDVSRRLPA